MNIGNIGGKIASFAGDQFKRLFGNETVSFSRGTNPAAPTPTPTVQQQMVNQYQPMGTPFPQIPYTPSIVGRNVYAESGIYDPAKKPQLMAEMTGILNTAQQRAVANNLGSNISSEFTNPGAYHGNTSEQGMRYDALRQNPALADAFEKQKMALVTEVLAMLASGSLPNLVGNANSFNRSTQNPNQTRQIGRTNFYMQPEMGGKYK